MKTSTKLLMTLLLLVVAASMAAVLKPGQREEARMARILQDGELREEIPLDKIGAAYSFVVEDGGGGRNTIQVERGRIRVSEANCPDQVCVGQGWISDGTVPIVCLPHGLVIEITGGGEDLDAAAG